MQNQTDIGRLSADEERWVLLWENPSTQPSRMKLSSMLAFFRTWDDWLGIMPMAFSGRPAVVSIRHGGQQTSAKLIHIDRFVPGRSTFQNPYGETQRV